MIPSGTYPVTVPYPQSSFPCESNFAGLAAEVESLLWSDYNIDVSTQDYDILSMFLAPGYTCVGGLAEVCGSELDWDQGKECLNWIASFQYPVLGHELYHNLGLDHTGYDPEANGVCDLTYLGEPTFNGETGNCIYGDWTSIMGAPEYARTVVFPQRVMLGYFGLADREDLWIDVPEGSSTGDESLQYALSSLNTPDLDTLPEGSLLGVFWPTTIGAFSASYQADWIDEGGNAAQGPQVIIHYTEPTSQGQYTPESNIIRLVITLLPGESWAGQGWSVQWVTTNETTGQAVVNITGGCNDDACEYFYNFDSADGEGGASEILDTALDWAGDNWWIIAASVGGVVLLSFIACLYARGCCSPKTASPPPGSIPERGSFARSQAQWVDATTYNGATPHVASRASMPVAHPVREVPSASASVSSNYNRRGMRASAPGRV